MSDPSSPSLSETWLVPESVDPEPGDVVEVAEDGLIGSVLLDTYAIDGVLGEGGMGRIYAAHHTRIPEKRFAVKVLRPELFRNPSVRARFEREIEAVKRISHPGVLSIVDVGKTALGWPYMVCEHLSGLDLLAYLRRFGALHTDRVVQIGCRIAEALEATHARGVIHRDVKPSNIVLLGAFEPFGIDRDRIKLIDFGLSSVPSKSEQLTDVGLVMGTPAYMSPEQAEAKSADHRTDIYGLGAVLYAAATGVPPFREASPEATLKAVTSREPVRPRELKPSISEGLERVILRAMAKRPEDRYPNMNALRLALSRLELRAGPESERPRSKLRRARSVLAYALVAYGAVSLVTRVGDEALARRGLDSALERLTFGAWPGQTDAALAATPTEPPALVSAGQERDEAAGSARRPLARPASDSAAGRGLSGADAQASRAAAPSASADNVAASLTASLPSSALGAEESGREALSIDEASPAPSTESAALAPAGAGVAPEPAAPEPAALEASGNDAVASEPAGALRAALAASSDEVGGALVDAAPQADADPDEDDEASESADEPTSAAAEVAAPSAEVLALKSEVLARAAERGGMTDALQKLERLFELSPESVRDADVRRFLRRAARTAGTAQRAAFEVMSSAMGSAGPDLLYHLMLNEPALAPRAKYKLTRHRVRKLFSPELEIAYDLRFAPSCAARLGLLSRAEAVGDQRSINVLAAMAGKFPRCGRRGQSECVPLCEREADEFSRAIDSIVRRLRGSASGSGAH